MAISLQAPDIRELKPRITVFGVGGAGGNAVNNMIESGLMGCEFVVANTDAQALTSAKSDRIIQMGVAATEGLGAGSQPDVGRAAAEEVIDEIRDQLSGAHMAFITAGMGGGTGTGAAPVIARTARDMGILTVGVVTKPFQFEGVRRMRVAEAGINELQAAVDTLIVIPNQNLFRVANEKTTFASAFAMADQVLYSGVACITDLMVKEGLINLDFADVRAIMRGMGKAMMGTGEASGEKRALRAAEAAIANPLLDDVSMKGARGLLISITGGNDLTLYEVDEAATRIREEVDQDANIILGATFDESLDGLIRVSVVATGIDQTLITSNVELSTTEQRIAEVAERLRAEARARVAPAPQTVPSFRPSVPMESASRAAPQPDEAPAPARAEYPRYELARSEPARHEIVRQEPAPMMLREEAVPAVQSRHAVAYEAAPAVDSVEIEEGVAPAPFIPPQPERVVRQTRMPRADEFPPQVQEQLRATRAAMAEPAPMPQAPVQQAPAQAAPQPAQGRGGMTLLQRLATVGFGPKKEEPSSYLPTPAELMAPAAPLMAPQAPPARAAEPAPRAPQAPHQEYMKRPPVQQPAYRPASGQLDPHGRAPTAQPRASEDDQLEIPAFLRRQAT